MSFVNTKDETTAEVSINDQNDINKFSNLLNIRVELQDRLKARRELRQLYEDAADELTLMDDEEEVQQALGDVFVYMTKEEAERKVETTKAGLGEEIDKIETELLQVREDMAALKTKLYAKFGKTINLEDDYAPS